PVFQKFDACCHVRSCVVPELFSKLNSLRRRRRIFLPASGLPRLMGSLAAMAFSLYCHALFRIGEMLGYGRK
ncbi:hypothetical protein ACHWGW_11030, partial [Klebsiella pneumoniae]